MQSQSVAQYDLERVATAFGQSAARQQLFNRCRDQRQRRPQLMRDVGEKQVLQTVQLANPLQRGLQLGTGLGQRGAGFVLTQRQSIAHGIGSHRDDARQH